MWFKDPETIVFSGFTVFFPGVSLSTIRLHVFHMLLCISCGVLSLYCVGSVHTDTLKGGYVLWDMKIFASDLNCGGSFFLPLSSTKNFPLHLCVDLDLFLLEGY